MADYLDVVHALWIEWRTQLIQTHALLALAGVDGITADPHVAFDEVFQVPKTTSKEERRQQIAALVAAAGG